MSDAEVAVDVAAIGHLLSISPSTVYRQAKAGIIPGFKMGREWRFFPSVVRAEFTKPTDPWAYSPQSKSAKRRGPG